LKIYINQDEIDYQFEDETTLGDVYNSIEKWVAGQAFSITEIFLDQDELYLTEKENWENKPFAGSKTLHFTALSLSELKAQNLQTILHYCQMFQNALKEGNLSLLNELLKEYSYIEGSFEILLEDFSHSIKDHMAQILSSNGFIPDSEKSEESVRTVLESFIMLEAVIQGRLDEISDPLKSGKECYNAIISLMPHMEEVSLLLQTGKDREAMDVIIRFSELFQKILRIFTYMPQEAKENHHEDLKNYIKEMSGILKELTEAFASEDSVLMGDLMEYEIMPRMKSFPRFFDSINSQGN